MTDAAKWRYVKLLARMWEAGGWLSERELLALYGQNWKRDMSGILDRFCLDNSPKSLRNLSEISPKSLENLSKFSPGERLWTQKRISQDLDKQWNVSNRQANFRGKSNANSNAESPSPSPRSKKDTPPSPSKRKPNGMAQDIELAFENWNVCAEKCGLPAAMVLTEDRKRKIGARLKEHGLDGWIKALIKIEGSKFLRGGSDSGWKADLEFLLQPKSLNKTIEGAYDNETK